MTILQDTPTYLSICISRLRKEIVFGIAVFLIGSIFIILGFTKIIILQPALILGGLFILFSPFRIFSATDIVIAIDKNANLVTLTKRRILGNETNQCKIDQIIRFFIKTINVGDGSGGLTVYKLLIDVGDSEIYIMSTSQLGTNIKEIGSKLATFLQKPLESE